MAWTYTEADVDTVDKDWIRFQIGDTNTADQLLSDDEIAGALARETRRDFAAARCADAIAADFARVGDEAAKMRYEQVAARLMAYAQIHAGTWSYGGNPDSSSRDKIRWLIGDVNPADQQFNNAEIDEALADDARVHSAAANCALALAAKYARTHPERATSYRELVDRLRGLTEVHAGTWTYSGDPNTSDLNKVRWLVGDVDPARPLLNNAEITEALADDARVHVAAANCALAVMARLALRGEKEEADRFQKLAESLRGELAEAHAGTWSYGGNPDTSNRDKVRFLIGDVNPANKLLNNAEIDDVLADDARPTWAAGRCAEALAARFAVMADSRSAQFLALAKSLREQAEAVQAGTWSYDSADLGLHRNWIRIRIGDSDTNQQQLNNTELDGFLALEPKREFAAALAAEAIAAKLAARGSSSKAAMFIALAQRLRTERAPEYLA